MYFVLNTHSESIFALIKMRTFGVGKENGVNATNKKKEMKTTATTQNDDIQNISERRSKEEWGKRNKIEKVRMYGWVVDCESSGS